MYLFCIYAHVTAKFWKKAKWHISFYFCVYLYTQNMYVQVYLLLLLNILYFLFFFQTLNNQYRWIGFTSLFSLERKDSRNMLGLLAWYIIWKWPGPMHTCTYMLHMCDSHSCLCIVLIMVCACVCDMIWPKYLGLIF